MCVVIDTCCLGPVLDQNNENHPRFRPILRWITKGNGSLIYGGCKYKKELKRAKRYLSLIAELDRMGKVIILADREVDELAKRLKCYIRKADFNDEHLVAIVQVARCGVVCTDDVAAQKYLVRSDLYPKGIKKPKIYKQARYHEGLCGGKYIVGICRQRIGKKSASL